MKVVSRPSPVLPALITILALADGILHFSLDIILFRGNFIGGLGPPPGAAPAATPRPPGPPRPQLPLPLNELFLLNIIGYVSLIVLFWLSPRLLGRWRWLVDVLMIGYVATILAVWLQFGGPNPMGLGYLSKAIEITLIAALVVHSWLTIRNRDLGVTPRG